MSTRFCPASNFHAHFAQEDRNGMQNWKFTLIYQEQHLPSIRYVDLEIISSLGLNERNVALD